MVEHQVFAHAHIKGVANLQVKEIHVANPVELREAFAQPTAVILIDGKTEIAKRFLKYDYWKSRDRIILFGWIALLVAMVISYGMSRDYKIGVQWRYRYEIRELDGTVRLTPAHHEPNAP